MTGQTPTSDTKQLAQALKGVTLPLPTRDQSFKPSEPHINELIVNLALTEASYSAIEKRPNTIKPTAEWTADASLVLVTLPGHQPRAFSKIASNVDPATGTKIFAFREVGASKITNVDNVDPASLKPLNASPVHLIFPGMADGDTPPPAEKEAALKLYESQRSPQSNVTGNYIKNSLFSDLEKAGIKTSINIEVFGHSLGVGNALYAKHLLSQNPKVISVNTTLFESYGAAAEASFILKEAAQANPTLNGAEFLKALNKNVSAIDAYPYTSIRQLHLGNDIANKIIGESYYLIDHSTVFNRPPAILPNTPSTSTQRPSNSGTIRGIEIVGELAAQFLLDMDDALHKPASNLKKLAADTKYSTVFHKYSTGNATPTLEQLQAPGKFNTANFTQEYVNKGAKDWLRSR